MKLINKEAILHEIPPHLNWLKININRETKIAKYNGIGLWRPGKQWVQQRLSGSGQGHADYNFPTFHQGRRIPREEDHHPGRDPHKPEGWLPASWLWRKRVLEKWIYPQSRALCPLSSPFDICICPQLFDTTDCPLVQIPTVQASKLISLLSASKPSTLQHHLQRHLSFEQWNACIPMIHLKHKSGYVSPSSPNLKTLNLLIQQRLNVHRCVPGTC